MRAELGLLAALAFLPLVPAPAVAASEQPQEARAAAGIAWPRQGRIRFELRQGRGGQAMLIGHTTHTWRHDGKAYFLQGVTEAAGLAAVFGPARIVQTSEGRIAAAGLVPQAFRVERKGREAERARFDWEGMKVTLYDAERIRQEAALEPGAQDILSQIYQVGLAGDAARTEMMIATGKRYRRHVYEMAGNETIKTRFGAMLTRYVKTMVPAGKKAMELWLARDHGNLPLRIRFTDRKGNTFEQHAVEVEADGVKLAERPR